MKPGGVTIIRKMKGTSRVQALMMLVFFVCLILGTLPSEAADGRCVAAITSGAGGGSGRETAPGTGGQSNPGTGGQDDGNGSGTKGTGTGNSYADGKPVITIDTVKLTGQSGTVIITGSNIDFYYLLVKEADQPAPSAEEIRKNGTKSRDGFVSMPPLEPDVEYVFYAVAEDKNGVLSDVISKRGATIGSRGIEVMGRVYCSLQTKDEIDDQTNQVEAITISPGTGKTAQKIEYIIADKFLSSPGLIETVATEAEDVNTAAGTSSVNISKWSDYDADKKPGLIRNMLNYIYVKITDTDGTVTYISSRGIWEDETAPTAMSISAETDETSALVTVTGNDDESGIKKYYLLVKDPIDLSAEEPENVKANGLVSDDGVFEVSGLTKHTRYDLCAVVEDKAGNLSPVTDGKMTTEGEQEASSVRQSEDTSGNPTGNSNVSKRTNGVTLEDPEITDTVEDSVPYIVSSENREYSGLTRISGWNNIGVVAEKVAVPADIYVDMNGGAVVPADVLEKIAGRDVTYHFIMDDTYIWVINGRNIAASPLSTDLRITGDDGHIPAKLINDLTGVYPRVVFSVSHVGEFGFPCTLDIRLGKENAGKKAHLYRYDLEGYRLEHVQSVDIGDSGIASFPDTASGDFVAMVGPLPGSEPEVTPSDTGQSSGDSAGAFANTKKESKKLWIIFVSVIGILLILFIAFTPKERDKDDRSRNE